MHIKDIETRTGLSRANIRYYEQEGLVHPVRARNGYRDYSQEDLDTLLRVRLLRRLDVPIEEIRAMQAGELDLADVLEERIRIAQRREEQARRDQAVCRAMQADRVRYDSLDPEKYWLALHTAAQAAPAAPQADRQEPCPWRRFLARNLDLALCSCAAALAMLAGHISFRQQGFSLLNTIGALLLMLAVEPVLLHLWGVTPGKLLLGLTVEQPDGGVILSAHIDVYAYNRRQAAWTSNFSTPSAAEMRVIMDSRSSTMSRVSAEMVTPAQPLVGMVWLMVRIFAPELAKIDRKLDSTPGLSFSRA